MFTHEIISEFNELEMSIYNCILKNKSKISHMKIKDLADEAHVSTATILRFCKKLGCEGYSEFKLRYREYLNQEQVFQTDSEETTLKGFVSRIDSREFRESIEDAFSIFKGLQQDSFDRNRNFRNSGKIRGPILFQCRQVQPVRG